jgi:transposase-like protein
LEHGKSISDIAAEYRVNENSVRKWVKKYQAMGIVGLEDRRGQRKAQQTPHTLEEKLQVKNAQLEHKICVSGGSAQLNRALLRSHGRKRRLSYLGFRSCGNPISRSVSQCHAMLKSPVKSRELNNPFILKFLMRTPCITSKSLLS